MYVNTVGKFRMSCKIEWNDQHSIRYNSKSEKKTKNNSQQIYTFIYSLKHVKKTDHMKTNMARQQKSIYCYIHLDSILFRSA